MSFSRKKKKVEEKKILSLSQERKMSFSRKKKNEKKILSLSLRWHYEIFRVVL